MRAQHKLFQSYPLDQDVLIEGETLTSPYHIYDGSILFIGGRADAATAAHLLKDEALSPILDADGQALVGLWVCDFTEANLGPHHELQVSVFASFEPQAPVKPHPLAIYRLLTLNPQAMMVCHGLWNNTARVVTYNRQHLGLDARLCTSEFEQRAGHWAFDYHDAESGQALLRGQLALPAKQDGALLGEMAGQLGLGGLFKTLREPFVHVPVVNTRSAVAAENRVAHTYTRSDRQTISFFDGGRGQLSLLAPQYAGLNIQPDFVQHAEGVRFVYQRPEAA